MVPMVSALERFHCTVVRGFLREKDSGNPSVQDLESEILADNKLLDEKIELGEKISKVLTNTNAK